MRRHSIYIMEICYRLARLPLRSCHRRHELSPAECSSLHAETENLPAEMIGYRKLKFLGEPQVSGLNALQDKRCAYGNRVVTLSIKRAPLSSEM